MTEDQLRQRYQDPDVPMEYTPPEVDRNQPDPGSIQSPHLHDQQREEHPTCRICQQQLEEGAEIRRLSCSHQFHALCIFRWAQERDSTCPICQETFPWYMTRTIVIEDYGTLKLMIPGSLWASRASFSIGFDNREPTIQGLPGQDSPINHIRESKTLIWARWPEEQELQSSRSVQNTDRNSSTVDQNQAEPGSAQTPPPCNQHSDELPECSVCLLEIEEEDKSSRLPCSHQFHNDCITRWMEQSRTCPLCRDGVNHHIWSTFDLPNYGRMAVIIPGLLSSLQPPVRMDFDREALTLRIHTPTRDE
ncbi:uncharacterized protein [Aquarana catesbeiana]|uniref:uncharacterized protein n=1 Tax=Aquarana catesbeiana TaxID=8400 RepID=UPI003CC9327D